MDVAFHIGAHLTDGERLVRAAVKNADVLSKSDIVVPGPGSYRKLLREAVQAWIGGAEIGAMSTQIRNACGVTPESKRLVLSNGAFLCTPAKIFETGDLYAMAQTKAQALSDIFAGDQLEIFLATRNPASFVPSAWAQTKAETVEEFMDGMDIRDMRWSNLVQRLRVAVPDARITVWCNEDTPLNWSTVLRRFLGADPAAELQGQHDLIETILTQEGFDRLKDYLQQHPSGSDAQLGRINAAFLGKYADQDVLEEDIEVPGWTGEFVDTLTNAYEVDLARISTMDGITFLTP